MSIGEKDRKAEKDEEYSQAARTNCVTVNTKHLMTGPEGNRSFFFPRISCFPEAQPRKTLRFKGNKMNCFPRDQSLSDLFCSTNRKTCNGGRRSTFAGNTALLPSDVIDFGLLSAKRLLAGNSFILRCHETSK